jgi:hypothetical protein
MKFLLSLILATGSIFAAEALTSPTEVYAAKTNAETPTGPEIFGVFRGRTPCQELSGLLNVVSSEACNKVKCRLFLYQDPVSKAPTTYQWIGKIKWNGKWSIVKGTKSDPDAIVYRLEAPDSKADLSFLKLDENVLYVLDREGKPLVGNAHFSYTLNRSISKKAD